MYTAGKPVPVVEQYTCVHVNGKQARTSGLAVYMRVYVYTAITVVQVGEKYTCVYIYG